MKIKKWIYSTIALLVVFSNSGHGAILPMWNDDRVYHPIPVTFVHGMNSSPEAWGFLVSTETGEVVLYFGSAGELRKYFDEYYTFGESREKFPYLEPFNYQFNTFDSIKWNAWEGWDNNGLQYPDKRIIDPLNRTVLKKFIGEPFISPSSLGSGILGKYQTNKLQLVAHSLGGVVSRYYLHNTKSGGANVMQLTTLGSPHRGTTVATISEMMVGTPVTDIQNMGVARRRWVIKFFSKFFSQLTVDRYPMMIKELNRTSNFIGDLNDPVNIPRRVRFYCIADALIPIPCSTIISPIITMTDGFIDLDSALASSSEEQLPCPTLNLEEYKPKGYLPKYKGKLISGFDNWHIMLTGNAGEILKAIDDTKPVMELTEVKDAQNKVIWRVGQWPDYFEVSADGGLKVHGLCRKEYLPADTYINIGFRKVGQTDVNWITESGGLTTDQIQARQWLLQPSDLWIASDSNSPVAEFEVEINFPLQELTHSIVVQATNPAGIKSDPVEVSEKTNYIYAVGKDDKGDAKFLCLDGPTSFADGVSAVVSEFNLIDETGNKISAKPLDIATDGSSTIWISFDNKKIYSYNITAMKSNQLPTGKYYYTTTGTPDGLYYDGNLQYCSSSSNKICRINLSNGTETDLGIINRRLSLDGVSTDNTSVNYTTQEYTGYNPTGISQNYLCSSGKISKRNTSIGQKFVQTLPTDTPIWMNEQNTPGHCLGIVEVTDSSVPGGRAIYYSSTDGNVYKVRFEDTAATTVGIQGLSGVMYQKSVEGVYNYVVGTRECGILWLWRSHGDHIEWGRRRTYYKVSPPASFIEAKVIRRPHYRKGEYVVFGTTPYWRISSFPMASAGYAVCSFDEKETNAELIYHSTIIGPQLWADSYDGTIDGSWEGFSPNMRVTDITITMPRDTFYITGRYGDEGQVFPISQTLLGVNHWYNFNATFAALTNNGSLTVLDQFASSIPVAEGITTGPRVKIKIEPEFLLLNVGISREFKVNGKGPYTWESSDETVAVIEGTIPQINGVGEVVSIKAVGIGVATITARDVLGNIAYANVDVRE